MCLIPSARQASAWAVDLIGAAVVGHQPLDLDPVSRVEVDGASQEGDCRFALSLPSTST
jgi:hypothetical protein